MTQNPINQEFEKEILKLKSRRIEFVPENSKNVCKGKDVPVRSQSVVMGIKKQAQQEEKYKTLLDLLCEGVVLHKNGIAIEMNASIIKMFGYSQKELVGQDIIKLLISKEDQQLVVKNFRKDYFSPYEVKGIKKNGTIFPIEIEGKSFLKTNTITIIRDLTSFKRADEMLHKSDKLMKSITSSVADAIISIDSNGVVMSWNSAAEKLFGYTSSEMINNELLNILLINYRAKYKIGLTRLKNGGKEKLIGKIIELEVLRKDGTKFPVDLSLSSWSIGNFPVDLSLSSWSIGNKKYFTGIIRDISKRKLAQDKLRISEERLSQIIKFSNGCIWEIDTNGLYTYASEKFEDVLGYTPTEIVGKKYFYDLVKEENREEFIKAASEFSDQKKSFSNLITPYASKNGNIVWISTSGGPILDNKGDLIGYGGIKYDITKQIKIEEKLKKAKRKAEESDLLKIEFIQNISHEIRTPMNAILGFSEMLNIPGLTDEKRANFVAIIQSSGNQLLQIIDEIFEISRLVTKQKKVIDGPINLNDFFLNLFSVFELKSKEKEISLYLKNGLSDRQCVILTDKEILNKALRNLLDNALKYTLEGYIEFGYQLKNNELEIYVKDTGIGIEPEKQEIIFLRFSQADKELAKKRGGLGLGLSIAEENIKLLGGSIRVESQYGEGSTFFITIPCKQTDLTQIGQ